MGPDGPGPPYASRPAPEPEASNGPPPARAFASEPASAAAGSGTRGRGGADRLSTRVWGINEAHEEHTSLSVHT